MPTAVEHSQASALVTSFVRKCQYFGAPDVKVLLDETHSLEFKSDFYRIAVYFSKIEGHPDKMWIRSTNWRAENEPCGIVSLEQARFMYRRCIVNGFTPF